MFAPFWLVMLVGPYYGPSSSEQLVLTRFMVFRWTLMMQLLLWVKLADPYLGLPVLEGFNDVFVIKYDASGNEVWTKQFGTAHSDNAKWYFDVIMQLL